MGRLAIIGGSGFGTLPGLEITASAVAATPWGDTAAPLVQGTLAGQPVLFLARHGAGHSVPPHLVNYRANIAALAAAGAAQIVALGAVGGIGRAFGPGVLAVPEQLIDYTHGRASSFHDGGDSGVVHIDFTSPYDAGLRRSLLTAATAAGVAAHDGGVCAVTQGPRLETAAEVRRLARDGCDLIGMTAMPEAALAREQGIAYATLAFVVNWAAGITSQEITMAEIARNIADCGAGIDRLLRQLVKMRAAATDPRT